jgi:thymidylate synthase (FAD)
VQHLDRRFWENKVMSDKNEEIEELRNQNFQTRRATVAEMEEKLYTPVSVLDHGFVRVIDYMGDDSAIVQAARVSYGQGTKKARDDRGLIRYLMRHWHSTPFEMCEIKLHVKLPIFVARQWIRHRTANVNEYSARYSVLDNEFYMPEIEHIAAQSTNNKQGRGEALSDEQRMQVQSILREDADRCYSHYETMINEIGVARELARTTLPVNAYTQWYWKTDLHNLFHFLRLRADSHAQYEIRVYAQAIAKLVQAWVPFAYEAFEDYRMNSAQLSAQALDVVRRRLNGETVSFEDSGLSQGEWREMQALLNVSL